MKHAKIVLFLMVMFAPSGAHPQINQPVIAPEIKKTVDAFVGHWILTGTDIEPGLVPVKFELTLDCKRTALGAAVTCGFAGKLPNVGPIEAAAVIGYSPDEQVVRWMEISSTGEYHDHKGRWKSDEIEFEPLEYSVSGKKATEYLHLAFPTAGALKLASVTQTDDGKSVVECAGKRVDAESK
jgi:hypothetical protein